MKDDLDTSISIILVDDHQILLDSLQALIEKDKRICIFGAYSNGKKALEAIRLHPQEISLAVLDISLAENELDGLHICKQIKQDHPHIKVLILSTHDEPRYITALVAAKADGYVLKQKSGVELIEGIISISNGEPYYSKEIVKIVMDRLSNQYLPQEQYGDKVKLTAREIEVLSWLGKGLSSKEVADKLYIAVSTIETHKIKIKRKVGIKNIKEIIIFARENGYVID